MKYINYHLRNNLILLLVIAFLAVGFCSCGNDGSDESSDVSEDLFTNEKAIELIERDRKITEMFVCNSLFGEYKGSLSVTLSEDNEFYNFSSVEELLNSTYIQESTDKTFFLEYPQYCEKSISDSDGKTKVFYHAGSNYDDFIDTNTVSVSDTDDENAKIINAKTLSGKEVALKTFKRDGNWLLENGIYQINPKAETVNIDPTYSNLGSFCEFSGRILVIELFVSDDETDFSKSQEEVFHNKIATAMDYLKTQSEKYGSTVEITYESTYFDHSGIVGTRPIDFDLDFAETTFGTLSKFAETNFPVSDYNEYFFVVCLDKDVKTTALRYEDTETTELYFGERVSIGNKSTSEEICSSILELLGVFDYTDERFEAYTESLFKAYFPNDFLLKMDYSTSEISPVTAYVCGMTDKLDSLFKVFITNR